MTTLTNLTVTGAVTQNTAATLDNHLVRLGEARGLVSASFKGAWASGTTYAAGEMVSSANGLYVSRAGSNTGHAPATSPTWWTLMIEAISQGGGGVTDTNIQLVSGTETALTATLGIDVTGKTVSFVYEPVTPVTPSATGYTIDLTTPSAVSHEATVLVAATGSVRYTMTAEDTATPGVYRGQFQVEIDGALRVYPESGWMEFEVVAAASTATGHYLYIGYASDSAGTGFSLSPGTGLDYIGFLETQTALNPPSAADFAGRWSKYKGDTGDAGAAGADGDPGASSYTYIGYARDASGTGFSTTCAAALTHVAFLTTDTELPSPQASDFDGLWQKYIGDIGSQGATGATGAAGTSTYTYVGYASDDAGSDFSTTPGDGLNYIAVKVSATALTPVAADFDGLWKRYALDADVVVPSDTDDLSEGLTNLYFTQARARATPLTGLDGLALGSVTAGDTLLSAVSKLQNRLAIAEAALSSPGQALYAEGQVSVPLGSATGQVSGLALGFTPTRCIMTVQTPAGTPTVLVAAEVGAPTTDGFVWALSAAPGATGYKINWRVT